MDNSDRPRPAPLRVTQSSLPDTAKPQTVASNQNSPTHPPSSHHHRHHHHHHHRHHVRDAVSSTVHLHSPSTISDLLRSSSRHTGHTSFSHKTESRRESASAEDKTEPAMAPSDVARPRLIRPEELFRERARRKGREIELRESLRSLTDHALLSTRQLDNTYYSLLDHLNGLQELVQHLHALVTQAHNASTELDSQAGALQGDVQKQIDAFGGFTTQSERIGELEKKVRDNCQKAEGLSSRLEKARERVKEIERLDAERWARTSLRLRIIGGILGAVIILVIALIAFQRSEAGRAIQARIGQRLREGRELELSSRKPSLSIKEVLGTAEKYSGASAGKDSAASKSDPVDLDRVFGLFDEL